MITRDSLPLHCWSLHARRELHQTAALLIKKLGTGAVSDGYFLSVLFATLGEAIGAPGREV